eukprot:Rhum_TRINITY_DN14542_c7_g1::Rhum_TRINITY_DN14542_c7_g1_i1::g.97548::m.97548/K00356/E1.6.99.3; NADH dehydrogenase
MMLRRAVLRRCASGTPEPESEKTFTDADIKKSQLFGATRKIWGGSGTNIADEEPLFGPFGYKPAKPMTQDHYAMSDNWLGNIHVTTTKTIRQAYQPKKVLPVPATKVAVFGATGFQGSRIAKRLVEAPEIEEVRLCTRYPDEIPPDLQKVIAINPEKCTVEETNCLFAGSVNKALQGCDAVINAIDMRTDDFYNLHHDVHVLGTQNIAYQARMCGISRFVQVSGLHANYGSDSDFADFRAKAEDMALAECFFGVVLRPGELYGEGMRSSSFCKQFYPVCYPNTKMQPTWVNDLAEATFRVVRNPEAVKRVIELGGPKVMTHMEYAAQRKQHLKGGTPFPCPVWLGDAFAFANELVNPRPYFSRNLLCELEMDMVGRTPEENPYLWSWKDLGMTPKSIEEATRAESEGNKF